MIDNKSKVVNLIENRITHRLWWLIC